MATGSVAQRKKRGGLPKAILTDQEVSALLRAPDVRTPCGVRSRALLEVLYGTGARIGELERACVADADLAHQTLTLRHTKGGYPRVVPLGTHATSWLGEYLGNARPALVASRPAERALFITRDARPLRQVIVRQVLDRLRVRAGIARPVTAHAFRHACATHMLQSGADIRFIQELLGHARLSTTTIYTRVTPVDLKAAHERFHPRSGAACR